MQRLGGIGYPPQQLPLDRHLPIDLAGLVGAGLRHSALPRRMRLQQDQAWHDPANALIHAENIARVLIETDAPAHTAYAEAIEGYRPRWTKRRALSPERRCIPPPHDAFGYLGQA